MKHASQQRTAGVGMAVGAFIVGSALWLSCQPGELPCDSNAEWKSLCNQEQAAGGTGGTGGGTPTGGTGGGASAAVTATTPVMDCTQWPTLGDMDRFFAMRCGVNDTCHGSKAPWTDMKQTGFWSRVTTEATSKAKLSCSNAKLANPDNWQESVLWTKTQTPATCPPGGMGAPGLTMPPQSGGFEPKMAVLNAEELKCLEGFLKAIGQK